MRFATTMSTFLGVFAPLIGCNGEDEKSVDRTPCAQDDGQCIFRHDTFGDEQLWTDTLKLHELVQTLSPKTALSVGLKVDATAVPAEILATADLEDPSDRCHPAFASTRSPASPGGWPRNSTHARLMHG
jgi:hypothetical protein